MENDNQQLSATEARIIGSLIEKEWTTPDVYPLTVNAIALACNQKTGREPVMELEVGAVGHALRQLETRGWVKAQHAARADRYIHRTEASLNLTRPQVSLLALLMLRGPQTAHELLTRSERMAKFAAVDHVQYALERLSQHDPALVRVLPRQSGQREDRYVHLLSGEPVMPANTGPVLASASTGSATLSERVATLEARVSALEALLSAAPGSQVDN